MTPVLLRALLVLLAWAGVFAVATFSGADLRAAELAAVFGAGVTLLAWGLLQSRAGTTADAPAAPAAPPEQRERHVG